MPTAAEGREQRAVLVIDDEEGVRQSMRALLEPRFRVLLAEGGREALDIVDRERIGVATLDLEMPGLSGLETLSRLRQADPALEVVVVTGVGNQERAVWALRHRAFDFVAKPFAPKALLGIIERADAKHRGTSLLPREIGAMAESLATAADVFAAEAILTGAKESRRKLSYLVLLATSVRDRLQGGEGTGLWIDTLLEQVARLREGRIGAVDERPELGRLERLATDLRDRLAVTDGFTVRDA